MAKVKKLSVNREKYTTSIEYEYRGKTYHVEYANDWTYCITPPHIQHEDAQRKIDQEIEAEKKQAERPVCYEDSAEYGFEVFWESVQ